MSIINNTTTANPREQRGVALATSRKISKTERGWIVPSQRGDGKYTVALDLSRCTCPDHELRKTKCKHIFAVEYAIQQEAEPQPEAKPERTARAAKPRKATYRQNWPAYNAAQTGEKATFQVLLHDLCKGIQQPARTVGKAPGGRAPLSYADMVFSAAFKVYATVSARRFISDLSDAHAKGYISKLPHFNSILNYLELPELTPLLHTLIQHSSLPLKAVESDFAVDASGFSTCRTVTWFNARYGHEQDNHDWLKVHLMCGVKTNIVTSVEITGRYAHDGPQFPALIQATAKNFNVAEVSADKGYSSVANLRAAEAIGARSYIPFKSHTTGAGGGCALWRKMWHFYNFNRDDFLTHYHKRSNVETTFAMIKGKFGSHLRSKGDTAQINEILCKVLCHNLCVLIHSMHELGIDPGMDR